MSEQASRTGQEQSDHKSDPTALTTDHLLREVAQMKELVQAWLKTIDQSVLDQKELRNAQLANVQQQLTHAESLRKELKADNEKNIDRALAGVEKATEKLEANMTRTLGQVTAANHSDIEGLRRDIDSLKDRINDNKERIVGAESRGTGNMEGRAGMTDSMRLTITVILAAIALVGFFIAQRGG